MMNKLATQILSIHSERQTLTQKIRQQLKSKKVLRTAAHPLNTMVQYKTRLDSSKFPIKIQIQSLKCSQEHLWPRSNRVLPKLSKYYIRVGEIVKLIRGNISNKMFNKKEQPQILLKLNRKMRRISQKAVRKIGS